MKQQGTNFTQDDGSEVRAVSPNGVYVPQPYDPRPSLGTVIRRLEASALRHLEGSYGYNELMGHAARHRATLAAISDNTPASVEETDEELAHAGYATPQFAYQD